MKKKGLLITIAVLVIILLGILCFLVFRKGTGNLELSLGDLKYNGEYQYNDLEWGASSKKVKDKLHNDIYEDEARRDTAAGDALYYSKNAFTLDGKEAVARYEFHKGQLQSVEFPFVMDDSYMEWFESRVDELKALYGEETEKMENTMEAYGMLTKGYKWNTDHSTLQIILVAGDSVTPTVHLVVACRTGK